MKLDNLNDAPTLHRLAVVAGVVVGELNCCCDLAEPESLALSQEQVDDRQRTGAEQAGNKLRPYELLRYGGCRRTIRRDLWRFRDFHFLKSRPTRSGRTMWV